MMKNYTKILSWIMCVFLGLLILPISTAHAASIVVDSTLDNTIAGDGDCTLREALANANGDTDTTSGDCTAGTAGNDDITFDASIAGGTITLGGTRLEVSSSLTITGPAAGMTINGDNTSTVLNVTGGTVVAVFSNLIITNGNDNGNGDGGGIRNDRSTLTVNNCTIINNTSASRGGGIYNYLNSTLTVNNSTIINNTSASGGGGIYIVRGTLTINNSTVATNSARNGGGIYNSESTATLNNSTVSANTASENGGGIHNTSSFSASTINLNYSTIATNIADSGSSGVGDGGGIYNEEGYFPSIVNLTNSIIAGNSDNSPAAVDDDCANSGGTFTSNGYNVFGKNGNAEGCPNGANDVVLVGAAGTLFYTLEDNGGSTLTHGLTPGGPAIDMIDNGVNGCGTAPFNVDQRGLTRPVDVAGVGGGAPAKCDAGAYEAQDGSTPTAVSLQSITTTNNAAIIPILIATLMLALAGGVALRRRSG